MEENKLSKFVKLMSKKITESDLELVNLGNSLGLDLVLYSELRSSQEERYTDDVREKALDKLQKQNDNHLSFNDCFYAGSIDFMVCDEPIGKKFFLLETNGGSNRGLSILTKKQQSILYDGYYEAINQAIKSNKRGDNKTLILVGVPVNDDLIHEKVIMIEYFRRKIVQKDLSVGIYNIENFVHNFKEDAAFLIADYKQLSTSLSFSDGWVKFDEMAKISVLIGDGIARRLQNENFFKLISEDFRKINSIVVNPIFQITDDKSLTYLASYYAKKTLEKYNLKSLLFTKSFTEEQLIEKLNYVIKKYKKPFIIKPNGGSGGAGVIPIDPKVEEKNLKRLIEISKSEFFAKFKENRSPYPYTIQEMASFKLIKWKNSIHTYDIRLYLAQKNGKIVPVGGLARIARGAYKGTLNKEEFVVNLSGFNGVIEVDRGLGISSKNAKILDLETDDFINMSCVGCIVFASIINNYKKVIEFSNWNQIIS